MEGIELDYSAEPPAESARRRLIEGREGRRYRFIIDQCEFDFAGIVLKTYRIQDEINSKADEIIESSLRKIPTPEDIAKFV